jgi:predicted small secreted protein
MHRLMIATALFAASAGCNTISGFGKDLQAIGGVVAGTAQGAEKAASPATPSCTPDAQGRAPAGCPGPS